MRTTRRVASLAAAAAVLMAACGGDGPSSVTTDSAETSGATQVTEAGNDGQVAVEGPSGTITVDGRTIEVSGLESTFHGTTGDFTVCTFSDGGDEGHVTIWVTLTDTERFYVNFGRPDGIFPSAEYPTSTESTGDVVGELTGGRAIGIATFGSAGPVVEFDVDCAR